MYNYESKYKFSSHSGKFYTSNKITKYCLDSTLVLFYILILVLVTWFHKENTWFRAINGLVLF